ncbi:hypothetical protein [Poriferisphaera sp. WC338]|uniref:hypothetical protein n=1 Tax=Poriferisphaera sp. WC338 TaxID=3425129 RepID=UPI003D8147F1
MAADTMKYMVQFGVAGLMGVLWVWERMMSRKYERQLSQAHQRLVRQQEELAVLIKLIRRNTQAIERFDQTQMQLKELLEVMSQSMHQDAA